MDLDKNQWYRLAEQIINIFNSSPALDVLDAEAPELIAVHGVCAQAVRHAQAALCLIRAGFDREATVNVRASLEHAITAQWARYSDDGRGRLIPGAHKKLAEFAKTAGAFLKTTDFDSAVADGLQHKGLPPFKQIREAVDPAGVLKFVYAVLSQHAHVTSSAVTAFVDGEEADILALLRDVGDPNPNGTAFCLALSTALSVYVVEDLREDKGRRDEIVRLADRGGVPSSLEDDIAAVQRSRAG